MTRDPNHSPFGQQPPQEPPPRLELLETCWRFSAPSGRVLTCGVYRTAVALEVRVGYGESDLLYSQRALTMGAARETAQELRQTVAANPGFTELAKDAE